ncbi:hypothetical protein FKM82_015925 [Ascaphus truei]
MVPTVQGLGSVPAEVPEGELTAPGVSGVSPQVAAEQGSSIIMVARATGSPQNHVLAEVSPPEEEDDLYRAESVEKSPPLICHMERSSSPTASIPETAEVPERLRSSLIPDDIGATSGPPNEEGSSTTGVLSSSIQRAVLIPELRRGPVPEEEGVAVKTLLVAEPVESDGVPYLQMGGKTYAIVGADLWTPWSPLRLEALTTKRRTTEKEPKPVLISIPTQVQLSSPDPNSYRIIVTARTVLWDCRASHIRDAKNRGI